MSSIFDLINKYRRRIEKKEEKHPNKVLPGDILYCNHSKHQKLIHCAMYIDNDEYIESLPGYGVNKFHKNRRPWIWDQYRFYYIRKLYDPNLDYDTNDIIDKAIKWAKDQEDSRYQYWKISKTSNYNTDDTEDHFSQKWICSELIWAAYMNASKQSELEKEKWINISDATYLGGSEYTFVDVDSIINNEIEESINQALDDVLKEWGGIHK